MSGTKPSSPASRSTSTPTGSRGHATTAGMPGSGSGKPAPLGELTTKHAEMLELRGLDIELLERLGIESAIVPGAGGSWVAVPYRRNGVTLNHKYRRLDEKDHRQDRGATACWWNYDCLLDKTLADQPLLVTEGEWDAIAAMQAGYARVISVPNGAPDREIGSEHSAKYAFVADSLKDLEHVTAIVLATDGDAPGINLRNDLAIRFGKGRCKYLTYPEGCKDLNDVLVRHGSAGITEVVNRAQWMRVSGLYRVGDMPPVERKKAYPTGLPELHRHYNIRLGDFCVITGIPGHGKSMFVNDLSCRMVRAHRWNVCFASFEQDPQTDHLEILRQWFHGKPESEQSLDEIESADAWVNEFFSFVAIDDDQDATLEWLLEKLAAAVVRYNAKICVIDPWNELDHARPKDMSLTEYVGWAIRQLKRFAKKWQVHLIVVAHPTKLAKGNDGTLPIPTMYDISDSSHWYNKPDVGVIIYRDKDGTKIRVAKSRYHRSIGEPGTITLDFNKWQCRYQGQ